MAVDLTVAKSRFDDAQAFDEKQQIREQEDLSFYEGEGQWPEDIRRQREGYQGTAGQPSAPSRPMITVNKVREPIRHVVNELRASELGVEVAPAGDFENLAPSPVSDVEIQLREGLLRRIQRESHAIDARVWAAERAVICGRGYYGVMTEYLPGKTFDQDVYLRRIYNQGSVLLDPAHEQPDGSDTEFAFVGTLMPLSIYKATYPKRADAKRNPLSTMGEDEFKTLADKYQGWFQTKDTLRLVRVVEYWSYNRVTRGLAQLKNKASVWDDELKGSARDAIIDVREVIDKQVIFSKLDGSDEGPLEETQWPGRYIPIIKVVGEEIQPYDAERRAEGMVRPARDSQRGFNYMVSKWVEMIGLTPVPPLMLTPQHVEGFRAIYENMGVRAYPWLPYNHVDEMGRELPAPIRPPVATDIQAVAGSVQLFDQAIKSTTAVPDPTLGNVDASVRSGKGIQALALNALKATAHFGDNFERSINYEGRILNDLLYPIYGQRPGRLLRVVDPSREAKTFALGAPATPTMQAPGTQQTTTQRQTYQLTPDVEFTVAVKVTKNYDTLREQEASTVMETISSAPEFMLPLIGDLAFKYQDGPGHNELADRMKFGLRPDIQQALSGQPGDPRVQALQQQVQQLQGMLQSKLGEIQAKGQIDLQKTQYQEQQDNQRTQLEQQTQITKAEIAANATMAVAQAKSDAENFRSYVDASENRVAQLLDFHMKRLDAIHDVVTQMQDQRHEAIQNALDRQHEQQMASQQHQQALEQQTNQAALQPPPDQNGNGA